jgi:formyltetrahydrofolate-dependent phosphoribosylglycinamide formyltransferase
LSQISQHIGDNLIIKKIEWLLYVFFSLLRQMLQGLQKKWKVNGLQLVLIICTFAIGGSLTGYAARKLMPFFNIEIKWLWIIIYIVLITLLWPLAVLLVSIPFGQFSFFNKYIRKIGKRVGVGREKLEDGRQKTENTKRIALFASGAGSNAQKIIDHFKQEGSKVEIALILSNNPQAGVLNIANKENIPSIIIEKESFFRSDTYLPLLKEKNIDFIVLAGFLWKLPPALIKAYPGKIINIHPALLPNYGGKGMYGHFVHEAVIAHKEKESGITIHYVDELYDHGQVIFQARCPVLADDTADSLAQRIHTLEHEHYPKVIEDVLGIMS